MYFIGCYIKEYQIKIKKSKNLLIIILTALMDTTILFIYLHNKTLDTMISAEYYIFTVILAVEIFLLFYDVETKNKILSSVIGFFAKVSFGTYLISFCFDRLIYDNTSFLRNNTYY